MGNRQPSDRPATTAPTRVPISALLPADSPRQHGIDEEHVRAMVESGAALPPILVHRPTMRVIDGMHRLSAARARGEQTIAVRFFDGPEDVAFVLAVETNITHGLPLSIADRRAAAARIVVSHPEWSDRAVARCAGLSAKTVAAIRAETVEEPDQLAARTGRDGRVRPLSSADGRRRASELIAARPDASLREIAREAGISLGTAQDVRQRVQRGDDPVPERERLRADAERDDAARREPRPSPDSPDTDEADSRPLLEILRKDPALRYSESGRLVLRWLDLRVVRTHERGGIVDKVPPHAAVIMAKLARRCAADWDAIAAELERRVVDAGRPADDPPAGPTPAAGWRDREARRPRPNGPGMLGAYCG